MSSSSLCFCKVFEWKQVSNLSLIIISSEASVKGPVVSHCDWCTLGSSVTDI